MALGGNYLASVSYSLINDLLLYSNIVYPDTAGTIERGNYFVITPDDAEVLNIHGELTGNYFKKDVVQYFSKLLQVYTYSKLYPWNKPNWDGRFGLYYNLRNKIIAGTELTAIWQKKARRS